MKILKTIGKLGCIAGIAVVSYLIGYENATSKTRKEYMDEMMDISDYDGMPNKEDGSERDGHENTADC